MNLQQVHLRINDAATGQPTPVRLRITDSNGIYYAPHGRLTEFATGINQDVGGNVQIGAKKWAYIDGACEILLPPGQLHVEISKGPEYKPIDEEITLLAGKMSLRFTIERWCELRKDGWYSGDVRVHYLSPDAAILEGQAEDVAVVNLLVKETAITDQFGKNQKSIPNILSFSGQTFARQTSGCGVAVNTHNTHSQLGSLGLLHCHRVVYPLTFDDPSWTLDDWCGQCHRKKGPVIWTDPLHETAEFLYGEPLADLILGNVDALELTFFENSPFDALAEYYSLLKAGITAPLVGASAKDNNGIALGSMRTYAFIEPGKEFTYSAWIDAVRAGRTFVTNGPLLNLTINGEVPMKLHRLRNAEPLHLRVEARSNVPFDRLELLWNGTAIATANPSRSVPMEATVEHELSVADSGWLAARCVGDGLVPSRLAPQRVFAHTSAVAVLVADRPPPLDQGVIKAFLAEMEKLNQWAERHDAKRLAHVVQEARTTLTKKLS